MAGNTDTRTVEIIVKGQQATASIKEMEAASAVMNAQLRKMSQDDPGREKLLQDYQQMRVRLTEANAEMRKVTRSAEELAAEQIQVVVSGKKVSATYNEMDAAAKQLERDIKDLVPGTEAFIKKSKELREVKDRMEEVDKSMKSTEKSGWAAKLGIDGITSASGLMKAGFQAAMAALLPLLAIEKVWELVQAFVGLVNEVDEVKSAISFATGAQGEMLDSLYAKVQALSRTFGDDYNEVLKAGDVLAKQMGISHEEAFGLIEKGYLAGANRSGEFLDNVKEYAVQYKAAGASAEEFITSVTQAEMGGVFSDKGADTVKEFGLRIREQTTATRDALDAAFGQEFTNRIFAGINSGKMTVMESLREVSAAMNDTTVPASKLQTVVADVFGGPGEDAGTAYLQSLYKVGEGLDSLIDKTNTYTQMEMEQVEAQKLLADSEEYMAQQFAGSGKALDNLWTTVKSYVYYGIGNFIQGMKQLGYELVAGNEYLRSWGTTVSVIFSALANRDWSAAKTAFTTAGSAAAKAYSDSYQKSMAENKAAMAAATKAAAGGPDVPGDVQTGGSSRQDDDKAEKAAEAAYKKAHAKELADAKKHAAELKKAREEAERTRIANERAIEDMQAAAIKDKYEREIQEINLQTNRKMEALQGDDEQIMDQWELMEQARQERIAAVREKQKQDEEKRKQEELQVQAEQAAADDEQAAAALELAFANGLMSEQAYQDALYNLKRAALESQLALVKQMKGEESAEYKRVATQILLNEADRVKKEKAQKQELRTFEVNLQAASFSLLRESVSVVEDNLNKKSAAYQTFKAIRKAAELAEVGIGLQAELQANALNAARNPLNSVPGGAALVATQLAIQNGLSIVRSVAAGIKIAAFKDGGSTGRANNIIEGRQMLALLSGASGGSQAPGGSFAGGGPVEQATIGLIGEAGPELVIPNWLYADPKQADLMGFLEATIASKGRAFADGGSTVPGYSAAPSIGGEGESVTTLLVQIGQVMRQLNERLEGVEDWQRNLVVQQNLQEVDRGLKVVQETREGGGIR